MHLYTSKLIENIFKTCDNFQDNILIEHINWNKITWNEYKNKALNYALFLKNKWIKRWDNVVIFVKNIVDFSIYALAVLIVWAKVIIVEADYSKKILEEKLKFINPDLVIIEGFLYYLLKAPFIKNISKISKYSSLLK